jgi:hypothetical protein
MMVRRAMALVVMLTLGATGWVECAGWQATPEARMACCMDGADCPMHRSTGPGAGPRSLVTQAEADSCCAASDRDDSTPSNTAFSLSLSAALATSTVSILAPIMAPAASFDGWRTQLPLPLGQVPKHVLLSVFLI